MKKTLHLFIIVLFVLASASLAFPRPVQARLSSTFYVTTSVDAHDSNLADGICYNGVLGGCSLRAAVEQAFSLSTVSDPVKIYFNPEFSGHTIYIDLGILEVAGNYITIDGQTNDMVIDGSAIASDKTTIVRLSGNHNTLTNLTIRNGHHNAVEIGDYAGVGAGNYNLLFNSTLFGNRDSGAVLHGGSSGGGNNNTLQENHIGVSLTSSSETNCVYSERNGGNGIYLEPTVNNTQIIANVIGCNDLFGIHIFGSSNTTLNSNKIGLFGSYPRPNGLDGVIDQNGQYTIYYNNTISGNSNAGVWLNGADNATFSGNKIGTDSAGNLAIPNGLEGIYLDQIAQLNTIGGDTSITQRNIISGNSGCGISIQSEVTGTLIDYNLIGLNAAGNAAVPNGLAGICLFNASYNQIGTSMNGVSQYISGNTREGIYILGGSDNIILQTNYIGVKTDNSPLGNGLQGIMLDGTSRTYVDPGRVSYNHGAGIALIGDNTAINNKIYIEHDYDNDGLAIDLGNDGPTNNDPSDLDTGPNHYQNYPVLTSFSSNPLHIQGTVCANCEVWIVRAIGNPNGPKGGGQYLDHVTANASGEWTYTFLDNTYKIYDLAFYTVTTHGSYPGDSSELSPRAGYFNYLPMIKN
jgi:parallel beta-helix repeat protein